MSEARTAVALIEPSPALAARVYRFIRRWPVFPILILAVLAVCSFFAPLIAPHDPYLGDFSQINTPPMWDAEGSSKYILGTDTLGRDILSRMIYGTRVSLSVAFIVLTLGGIGGVTLGLVSGYYGGQLDELLMRIVDFTIGVPFILVAIIVIIAFGQSLTIIIALLAVFSWGGTARLVRAESLSIKTRDYVALAQVAGASTPRILWKHLLPGVINTVIVVKTLQVGSLILTESILSYLGVGIPPPTPAWGVMVADGRDYLVTAWWIAFFPGMAIFMTVLAFNFLGDWMRDKFDPRLRQLV